MGKVYYWIVGKGVDVVVFGFLCEYYCWRGVVLVGGIYLIGGWKGC